MMYYLVPMKDQSDFGFGMMASTFLHGADKLKAEDKFALGFEYLPICYLKRHSLELFLKSFIILLHKNYEINYGDTPFTSDKPKYQNNKGEWQDLYKEHDLSKLFQHFKSILDLHRDDVAEKTMVSDWPFFNEDYLDSINEITDYDNHSDFFRYPMSKDKAKDGHKQLAKKVSFDEALEITKKQKGMFLAVENSVGDIKSLYSTQSNPVIDSTQKILDDIAYHFDCFHTALRVTMFNGL